MRRSSMPNPRWVSYPPEKAMSCPYCGGDVEVLTALSDEEIAEGQYMDDDPAQCTECCGIEDLRVWCDEDDCFFRGSWPDLEEEK